MSNTCLASNVAGSTLKDSMEPTDTIQANQNTLQPSMMVVLHTEENKVSTVQTRKDLNG
jgi:hypothetical protein